MKLFRVILAALVSGVGLMLLIGEALTDDDQPSLADLISPLGFVPADDEGDDE